MMRYANILCMVIAALATSIAAHPGHEDHSTDHVLRRHFLEKSRRSLSNCEGRLVETRMLERMKTRREATLKTLRRETQALKVRDTDEVLAESHHSNLTGITINTEASTLFADRTCILSPEGEIGPFWVKGELDRRDIVDNEPGVVNYMHAQFIDVNTCEPISGLWWDVWNCNSTGVYSGVQDSSNGNGDDASNLNNTALRGLQMTDEDGIAEFRSIFPGHYSGRATHVHVVGHVNATLASNGTITDGVVAHIGQLFFDQDLITEVESTYPYNTSTVNITLNSVDRVFATETNGTTSDPVFEYTLLGDDISDGLFSWITIGVDTTATYNTSYAALLTATGGVANAGTGGAPN